MKFEVYGKTQIGTVMHIVNAGSADEAKTKFLNAHPKSKITAVGISNKMQLPIWVEGNGRLAGLPSPYWPEELEAAE